MPDAEDAALVRALLDGSEAALAALYDRHADAIFAASVRASDDRQLAEEVVQETFLALWDRAELFDPAAGSLATWLRAIARNRTIDRLRAKGRRPRLVSIADEPGGPGPSEPILEGLAAAGGLVAAGVPDPDPTILIERAETAEVIRAAIRDLPDAERTVIVLAYQEDLTQSEIAERMGWPLGTVKTRTRRALLRLRAALGEADPTAGAAAGPDPASSDDASGAEGTR
jgi:RNA polymerase sigma-70 factor (ECF subfamily)